MRARSPFPASLGSVVAVPLVASVLLLGCGDDSPSTAPIAPGTTAPEATIVPTAEATTTVTVAPVTVEVDADSFVHLLDMTPVRGFFVDNLLGDLEATVAVAENPEGSVYPPGSVVQLIPNEAMVKREPGFSPTANDWEFFELVTSEAGTDIAVRGGAETVNQFGLSCADCHSQAEPRFDFICEQTHGCDPLPFDRDFFEALQQGDPRPRVE